MLLQITGDVLKDIAIPGKNFGFSTLLSAQALGDGNALASRNFPLLRLNLTDRSSGIAKIIETIKSL